MSNKQQKEMRISFTPSTQHCRGGHRQYSKARENRTHIDWIGKTDTFTFLSENIGHLISILENLIRIKELMSL